ncbi:MAG: AI-2E family transporter, partial [Planctomycetales bacterium]
DNQNFLGTNPWIYVAAVVAIFFIVQQINSLITAPKIVGDSVGLHPMTVIFSMLFWSLLLGGFIGALLAVPMTAAVKVLFRRYVWERKLNEPPADPTPAPKEENDVQPDQIELA